MDTNLIAFVILACIAMIMVTYFCTQELVNFMFYAKDSDFPSVIVFFLGTFVSFFSLAFVGAGISGEGLSKKWVVLMIPLFYLFYIIWVSNLILRAEFWVKGSRVPKLTGALWLFFALFSVCLVAACGLTKLLPLIIIPIAWTMFMMWQWLTKT